MTGKKSRFEYVWYMSINGLVVVSFYHDFLLDYNLIIKGSLLVFFSSLITAMAIIISHFLAQNQFILLLAPYTIG